MKTFLFFTDNTNPPRVINIETNYPNPLNNTDGFTARQIQVVKQPPLQAPTVQLIKTSNITDAFLENNFICFGYRYRYETMQNIQQPHNLVNQLFRQKLLTFSSNSLLMKEWKTGIMLV